MFTNTELNDIDFTCCQMWSPYALPNSRGALGIGAPHLLSERAIYSHEEYINLVLHTGQIMSHDYSTQSTEEVLQITHSKC